MKCGELLEIILREKPHRTTRLIHSQSYTFDSSNFSILILSIDIPLRVVLAKSYLTTFISMRSLFGARKAVQR